jgi:hypothetical protein
VRWYRLSNNRINELAEKIVKIEDRLKKIESRLDVIQGIEKTSAHYRSKKGEKPKIDAKKEKGN